MPPRRPSRSVPTVLIPDAGGAQPDGWQAWLAGELSAADREVRWVQADEAELAPSLAALRECLADLPADNFDVVAHGTGSLLWLHHVADPSGSPRAARVVLVAPPAVGPLLPVPLDIDTVRHGADGTVLVAGNDDPALPDGVAVAYGVPLKIATTVIDGGGHLDAAAGYGEWPAMLSWCRRDNLAFY